MALGVIDVAKTQRKIINQNIFIGGFDWTAEALQAIENDQYTASVGGHFMQTAWALINIYDHHNGKQLPSYTENKPTYQLNLIDRNNIDDYQILLNNPDWDKVNFRQLSLSHQAKPTHYQYDFSVILAELNR